MLYTPLGQLSKDILYWSTIGSSYSYNIVVGGFECLAALLLIFKKNRPLGLVIAFIAFGQIVLINFSFDISVKVLSLFLLGLTLYLLTPVIVRLYRLWTNGIQTQTGHRPGISRTVKTILITFFVGLMGIELVYQQSYQDGLNDDLAKRPYLHGAYQLQAPAALPLLLHNQNPVKRFFVHRRGFLIFQHTDDQLQDFGLRVDSAQNKLWITNYYGATIPINYNYNQQDSLLILEINKTDSSDTITGKAIDWKKLPLMQNDFHWTVDGI